MAFRRVGGARKYFKYAECTEGQKLVENGVFVGSEEGTYGIQHLFRLPTGETVVLNSAGHLNFQIENYVITGQAVNVAYAGKREISKGPFKGKECHTFDVEVEDTPVTAEKIAATMAAAPTAPAGDDITL